MIDYIGYDGLVEKALRSVLHDVLLSVQAKGLEGDHYFLIRFYVNYPGVDLSDDVREQYPHDMTIVLQNQFEDLQVASDGFSVQLVFNGKKERINVPFNSISSFADPGACFGLKFSVEGMSDSPEEIDEDDSLDKSLSGEVINIKNYLKKY